MPLSAATPEALAGLAERYRHFFTVRSAEPTEPFHSLCRAYALADPADRERVAVVGRSADEIAQRLAGLGGGPHEPGTARGTAMERAEQVVFVCSGQGAQWAGMGASLLRTEPVFRSAILECEERIRRHGGWSLVDLLQEDSGPTIDRAEYAQPATFAVEIALGRLWESWGLRPAAVIGHSSGEVAAAHLAGALSLEDALKVVLYSGQLLRDTTGAGGMAMVHAHAAALAGDLAARGDLVAVAAVNSPESTVISGEPGAIKSLAAAWRKRGIASMSMPMDHAFHTAAMNGISRRLTGRLGDLEPGAHRIPFFSTVFGRKIGDEKLDAEYWGTNLRSSVRFDDAVRASLHDGFSTFLEVSPHPVLLASIGECARHSGKPAVLLSSLRRRRDDRFSLLSSLGQAYTAGCSVDWETLYAAKPDSPEVLGDAPEPAVSALPHTGNLTGLLREEVRRVLGLGPGDALDDGESFFDLGFDSLLAVQFRDRLAERLNTGLQATLLFDFPSIRSLAAHLDGLLGSGPGESGGAPQALSLEDAFLVELESMPEDEALRLLQAELDLR
ncbi:MAG TPA: acyltransferase domain-containing protein [Bryobacteraceae bacterium]|nr:acyltransferase domain-containing protein [Bryobacteraceae bacterium]